MLTFRLKDMDAARACAELGFNIVGFVDQPCIKFMRATPVDDDAPFTRIPAECVHHVTYHGGGTVLTAVSIEGLREMYRERVTIFDR